jgi:hypothetical protein
VNPVNPLNPLTRGVLVGLLAAEAVLVALHIPARAADAAKIVRMDEEANLPTWFSSSQFLIAALACAALAASDAARRTAWGALGAVMLFFSLDEIAEIHERVEDKVGDADLALLVLQPLVGVAVLLVVWRGLSTLGPQPRRFLLFALAAAVAAQAMSVVSGDEIPDDAFGYTIQALEEVFELLTGTFVLVAALEAGMSGLLQRAVAREGAV